jgi:hypothetical protein
MIEHKQNPSQPFNWFLFGLSFIISLGGIYAVTHKGLDEHWTASIFNFIRIICPVFFYTEILKHREGFTKVAITNNKLFKCRVSGTEEVFYLKADSEQEAELFFETIMEGKNVFIEEANIKLVGFDMQIPKEAK